MFSEMRMLPLILVAVLVVGFQALAWGGHNHDVAEFDEAEVLVEINATDGDAGFQGELDGEPWRRVRLRGPAPENDGDKDSDSDKDSDGDRMQTLFHFGLRGSAREQGFTEFVWESAEPEFSELGLAEFLERFPEGDYEFTARTIEGGRLKSTAELTHDLPAGPNITSPEEGEEVPSGADLVVEWDAVTTTFAVDDPMGEMTPPLDSDVVGYIVVAEFEDEDEDIKEEVTIQIQVLPGDTSASFSATIPGDFFKFPDSEGYKVEVGVVEESGNRTFTELPICTDMECPEEDDEE